MRIGDLPRDELHQRFGGAGVRVRIGPFIVHLYAAVREFVTDFSFAYADFPICGEREVSDFRMRLVRAGVWRQWRGAQFEFLVDGQSVAVFPRRLTTPHAEWVLNWCIFTFAYQFLIFHSAVVEKGGRAAILAGPPGSGKSTLCVALLARGWRLLSDEFALLDPARGGCLQPIPRPVALKGASIELAERLLPPCRIGRVFAPTRKGTLAHLRPPTEAVQRQAELALPGWVLFPTHADNADTRLLPLGKRAGFQRLEENSFNYFGLGLTAFDALAQLIEMTECYELPFAQAIEAAELVDRLAEPVGDLPLGAARQPAAANLR